MEQAKQDNRRHFRWPVDGPEGRIAPNHRVSLLDISQGGALIEHSHLFRAGTLLFMTVFLGNQDVGLKCRVVRSLVYRYEVRPTGEHDHFYRTGLEFLNVSDDSRHLMDEYIDLLSGEM